MPRIRTPEDTVRRILFAGNNSELIRKTGMSRTTFYSRKKDPSTLTLTEAAALLFAQEGTPEEAWKIMQLMS